VIAIGHRNRWEVSQIQYALRKEGLWSGPIDGVYSENLAQSVSAAQKKHRLPETGTADYATLMALPEDKVPRAPARGDEISPSNRVDH
jgi:peptidoglycan hydrolase-like protein with peptidoglycan-binding domain